MTLLQQIRRSFLTLSLAILLICSIAFSFGTEPSFAATSQKEPDLAIGKKGKMKDQSVKSQVQVDKKADQLKAKTLEGIDRSIGKATAEKPDKQNEEVRESTKDMESEAREAFK
jgi:predicted lipid-binding transport protein (Tim44 family)